MSTERLDLVIVGSGPAGLSAAQRARFHGLAYAVLERADHLADTIHCYQKGKHVMAEPSLIPQLGELPFAMPSEEPIAEAEAIEAEPVEEPPEEGAATEELGVEEPAVAE